MDKIKKLNILFTSDTHGWLLPINYSDNSKSTNGLSVIANAMKEYSRENSILMDLGDTIQGSPLLYFHQINRKSYPNPAAQMMNYLNYDYFIPGNHDFNYGMDYLDEFITELNAKTLCANIATKDGLLFKQGFEIVDKNGVKILIIGITTKYIPNWENPNYIKGLIFNDPVVETEKIVNKYRKEVDLVVVAYHGGFERDILTRKEFVKDTGENQGCKIFANIKGVDILLTGHQHRIITEKIDNRILIQPGCNGANLGAVEIEYTDETGFKLVSIQPKLLKAGDYKSDPLCEELIKDVEKDNQVFLDEIIGIVPKNNLAIKDPIQARIDKHPIVDFINCIQIHASNSMLSATSLANIVTGFREEITVRNVLSTYVYSNTLAVVEISGKVLKEYLEKCAEYFVIKDGKIAANPRFSYPKVEHYNYDMIDGIDYVIDVTKKHGDRIESIKYKNKEIDKDDLFTIVLNNYRASGGGDFLMLKDLPIIREIPFNVAELILDYIRENRVLDVVGVNNIKLKT
ncbi:MAG: bifunctional metallophosphatase/5'-nucleotidase [Tenericutes bacterium]|nr:bifunctional metallophosphatase/5'-nucleotidase [Mycoplasmatota bacterium]